MGTLLRKTPSSELLGTLNMLDALGIKRHHLTLLRTDLQFQQKIKSVFIDGAGSFIPPKVARQIMEDNFYGPQEWWEDFNEKLPPEAELPLFPWNERLLTSRCPFLPAKQIRETHFAFLGLECLSRDWWEREDQSGFISIGTDQHLGNCKLSWYLMPIIATNGLACLANPGDLPYIPHQYFLANAVEELTKRMLLIQRGGSKIWGNLVPEVWHPTSRALCMDKVSICYSLRGGRKIFISSLDPTKIFALSRRPGM